MDKSEAYDILVHYDDLVWRRDYNITEDIFAQALDVATEELYATTENPITEDNLSENGWVFNEWEYEKFDHELKSWDKTFNIGSRTFYCTLRPGSNTPGRDWYVHIDNNDFESVGSMDVATYNQIDNFLKLLNE